MSIETPSEVQLSSIPLLDKYQNPAITSDQIKEAIENFRHQFSDVPELAQISDEQLLNNVSAFLQNDQVFKPEFSGPPLQAATGAITNTCPFAIAVVVVDCVFLVLSFVGLCPPDSEELESRAVPAVARVVAADAPGWQRLIANLQNATTATEKAKAIFFIAAAAYKAGMVRGILATIAQSMTWADWAITGVAAVAQISILLLSDGAAFIAKVALAGASLAYVVSDSVKAVNICKS